MKIPMPNPSNAVSIQVRGFFPAPALAANTPAWPESPISATTIPTVIGLLIGLLLLCSAASVHAQTLTAEPSPLIFAGQQVNTYSSPATITWRNTSNQSVTVDSESGFAQEFTHVGGNCGSPPFTLPAQSSCTYQVMFHPAVEQSYSDNKYFYSNGALVGQVQVTGNGVVGRLTLTPFAGLSFSPTPVGATSAESVAQLGNNGSGPVQVVSITSATIPFARVGGTCVEPPFFLAPGATCSLRYAFSPVQIGTAQRQVLSIQVPASMGTSWFLSLQGDAVQGSQTITFPLQPARIYAPGYSFPVNPPATASSGLAVVYGATTPAVCSVSGSNVAVVAAGSCNLTANQPGNASWAAAAQETRNFAIARANQTLTFPTQVTSSRTFVPGSSFAINPPASSAMPNAGQPIVYSSLDGSVCTVNGTQVTMVALGACSLAANQSGNTNYNAATQVTVKVQLALFSNGFETLQ